MARTTARLVIGLLVLILVGVVALVVVALRSDDDEVEVTGVVGRLSRGHDAVILDDVEGLEGADDALLGGPLDGGSLSAALVNPSDDVEVGQHVTGTYLLAYDILYVD